MAGFFVSENFCDRRTAIAFTLQENTEKEDGKRTSYPCRGACADFVFCISEVDIPENSCAALMPVFRLFSVVVLYAMLKKAESSVSENSCAILMLVFRQFCGAVILCHT